MDRWMMDGRTDRLLNERENPSIFDTDTDPYQVIVIVIDAATYASAEQTLGGWLCYFLHAWKVLLTFGVNV